MHILGVQCSCSGLLLKVHTSRGPRCSPQVTEISTSSESAILLLTSTSLSCEFSAVINSPSSPGVFQCELNGKNSSMFICHISNLEPGTLHQVTVISKKDGGQSSTYMRTGKAWRLVLHVYPYQEEPVCFCQSKFAQRLSMEPRVGLKIGLNTSFNGDIWV